MTRTDTIPATSRPVYETVIGRSPDIVLAAQKLRYQVFVQELGGTGEGVDHTAQTEADVFDPFADHLVLLDRARPEPDQVVGVYRLMTTEMAARAGQFYCEGEYDISPLRRSGLRLLELGRSCLHRDYRGGDAMIHLWSALADYVERHGIEVLFGVASFHGTDTDALAQPLSLLHHKHLVRPDLRAKAIGPTARTMDIVPAAEIDRLAAVRALPSLIKGYLKLGGCVGDGFFVDHAFNTTDVLLILEKEAIGAMQRNRLLTGKGRPRG